MTSKINDSYILSYPIAQLAADLGLRRDPKAKDTFFAPGRDEKTASLKIYPAKQQWRDYGAGCGGGLLDLILYCAASVPLPGDSSMSDKARAMAFLKERVTGTPYPDLIKPVPKKEIDKGREDGRRILVENWRPGDDYTINDAALLEYAAKRKWNTRVLEKYCRQIRISIKGTQHKHVLIGFPNIENGYVLRGPGQYGKMSTNQAPTMIDTDGAFTVTPSSPAVMVFEGFGNLLAKLSLDMEGKDGRLTPPYDVIVLNSWQNIKKDAAKEYILKHKAALWYGDNDKAGRQGLEIASSWGIPVIDKTPEYAVRPDIDDYNDFTVWWYGLLQK